jgi:hypothetical protein
MLAAVLARQAGAQSDSTADHPVRFPAVLSVDRVPSGAEASSPEPDDWQQFRKRLDYRRTRPVRVVSSLPASARTSLPPLATSLVKEQRRLEAVLASSSRLPPEEHAAPRRPPETPRSHSSRLLADWVGTLADSRPAVRRALQHGDPILRAVDYTAEPAEAPARSRPAAAARPLLEVGSARTRKPRRGDILAPDDAYAIACSSVAEARQRAIQLDRDFARSLMRCSESGVRWAGE